MYELPAYLIWGFLESGKSTLIKETLSQDYFNDGEKTMILTFEEGEVEYDKEMLEKTNSFVVNIENMEDFTKEFVRGCQRNYYPDRVMIEYNGMYSIDDLMDVVDETDLELYQVIVTVDASTADLYLKNLCLWKCLRWQILSFLTAVMTIRIWEVSEEASKQSIQEHR